MPEESLKEELRQALAPAARQPRTLLSSGPAPSGETDDGGRESDRRWWRPRTFRRNSRPDESVDEA